MPSMQTQREVVVTIRDPSTVQSLLAMNPRNLNAHVERAIAQSGNENIAHIKVLSSNQLKIGDLSIKTATSREVAAALGGDAKAVLDVKNDREKQ
ncbi:hypothetical protein Alg130_09943, partial [Pyrenophora tritici-repentis]